MSGFDQFVDGVFEVLNLINPLYWLDLISGDMQAEQDIKALEYHILETEILEAEALKAKQLEAENPEAKTEEPEEQESKTPESFKNDLSTSHYLIVLDDNANLTEHVAWANDIQQEDKQGLAMGLKGVESVTGNEETYWGYHGHFSNSTLDIIRQNDSVSD